MDNNKIPQVVCFGEILWDILPSKTMPGGAPMNVAYHLKKLGNEPTLITKVGVDDWGKKLFDIMEEYKISTDYFQIDYTLETGKVYAKICENNEVEYDIVHPVAWDDIQWQPEFETLLTNTNAFVFGTLSARCGGSRNTLYKLLEIAPYKVLDINLRPPHFNRSIIEYLLRHCDLLKLNQAELELITGWFTKGVSLKGRVQILQDKFHIPVIVVTRGGEGAFLNVNGDAFEHPGYKIKVADTIGSGDAFLAAMIDQSLRGKSSEETLMYASALGALIAGFSGACPEYTTADINAVLNTKKCNQINQEYIKK